MSLKIALFTLTCIICYGLYRIVTWHVKRRRLYEMASKFTGPPVLPIIGNAHMFIGNSEHLMRKLMEFTQSYPSPFRVWIGPRLFLVFTDPESVKEICTNPNTLGKADDFREFGRPVFGNGLLTASVPQWRVNRKLIQPTFNAKILDSFVNVFAVQSRILVERLEKNVDGPEFEIFDLIASCTLDMICETAIGVKVGAQTNQNCRYVEAVQQVVQGFCKRFFHIWLHPDFIFHFTQLGRNQRKFLNIIYDFTNKVIQMRKNEHLKTPRSQQNAADAEHDVHESTPRREVFLDQLIKLTNANYKLTDELLHDEVNTMVLAGNDTSTITVSFAMLMLASHPEVQDKLYEELCEIYGECDDEDHLIVTAKDLPRMKYLERVLKESMRLFPMAPLIVRGVSDDVKIGENFLPKGSSAVIGIMQLHRNEKYWPDPLKFDPDRFLPEEAAKRHPYAYLPFSGGPRNCIGMNYAMMSMKTMFATILRRYILKKDDIVPMKDVRLKLEILMKTADPFKLRIVKRIKN